MSHRIEAALLVRWRLNDSDWGLNDLLAFDEGAHYNVGNREVVDALFLEMNAYQ